jgi:hypothetical protein
LMVLLVKWQTISSNQQYMWINNLKTEV